MTEGSGQHRQLRRRAHRHPVLGDLRLGVWNNIVYGFPRACIGGYACTAAYYSKGPNPPFVSDIDGDARPRGPKWDLGADER